MIFSNKTVIVTGAASGIGKAIALLFAQNNANLTIIDVHATINDAADECRRNDVRVVPVTADLRDDNEIKRIIELTLKEFGRIDVLVNCAGIYSFGSILTENLMEVFDRTIAVNLRAVVALTHATVPHLIKTKGCIINISSINAQLKIENMLAYNVSKAGVSHFTKCIAQELSTKGVRVNAVAPGAVKTELLINAGMSRAESDKFWDEVIEATIKPEDIAEMVIFLASDKAKCINGVDYAVDDGFSLRSWDKDAPGV